jgi:hypothetical protein
MKKWEYVTFYTGISVQGKIDYEIERVFIEKCLYQSGQNGFELVTVTPISGWGCQGETLQLVYTLKRPVEEADSG